MIRIIPLAIAMLLMAGSANLNAQERPVVTVWKSKWCGCCTGWVRHMERAGYTVQVHDTENLDSVKIMAGVPEHLQSCHTATVGGYTIEGHVPVADVERLLDEKPQVVGLSVPGMPSGSPGMENGEHDSYDVVTFTLDGKTEVFSSYK